MSMRDLHLGFRLDFDTPEAQDDSEDVLIRLLGLNSRLNLMYLRRFPETPLLYESGIVYTDPDQTDGRPPLTRSKLKKLLAMLRDLGLDPETALMIVRMVKGIEIFLDIPALLRRGKGDCNELVPMRIAELWRAGIMASPYLIKARNSRGGWTYHAQVLWPDGSSEDPSLILGMGGRERADERREEIRKNAERWGYYVQAANRLVSAEGASPAELTERIAQMGLWPRNGVFRSPYEQVEQNEANRAA